MSNESKVGSQALYEEAPSSEHFAFLLLNMCDQIQSLLGPKLNREWREHVDVGSAATAAPLQQRTDAAKLAFLLFVRTFANTVGAEVVDELVSVQGNTPETARTAVLSWIDLIAPLVAVSHDAATARYTPIDLREALLAIKPETLRDALWAPGRAKSDKHKDRSTLLIERVMALALARSLKRAGHNLQRVHTTLADAFLTDWETMRRWEQMGRDGLGDTRVDHIFEAVDAGELFPPIKEWSLAASFIHSAGATYRRRMGFNVSDMSDVDGLQRVLDAIQAANDTLSAPEGKAGPASDTHD